MVNQDPVIGEIRDMPLVQDTHFVLRNNHILIQHSPSSGGTLLPDQDPDMDLKPVEVGEMDHDYFLDPAIDHVDEYHNPYNDTENKYVSVDQKSTLMENGGDNNTINNDDDDDDGGELGFAGNDDLADTKNILDLIVHGNNETIMQPQYLLTSPIVQSRTELSDPIQELSVGQEFPDAKSCRRALRELAIAGHFEIQTVKSDKTRFTAKCASEGCPWRVHAAKLPGVPTFTIRTILSEHKCGGIDHLGHSQASVQWVANSVEQSLKENPHCKPKDILEEIHRVHGITLSYKQAWRGKERFMASFRDSFEEDYRLLPQYCEQIRRTNPGSMASICVNPMDNSFQRLFISYQASIFGFLNACVPLIGLDRSVLKNKYLGTMLFASAFDGEGAFFPLAFGVVDEESDETWMWFLSELRNLLDSNTENMPRLTILSDRRKSTVDAVESNFPTAFHGFCMLHLSESFRKEFTDALLCNLFWEAANSRTINEFDSKLLEIEEISQDAAYWIQRIPPRLWAQSHFEGTRLGNMTANIAESLNSWIVEASGLPIIQMMECIRRQLMTWFNERREDCLRWGSVLVPSAENRVSEAVERASNYQVLRSNEAEFEVISHEGTNVVDIRNRCCTCRGWEIYGLPCGHAVTALLSCRQNVHRFAESCFTVASYRKAYSQTIHPVPDRAEWGPAGGVEDGGDLVVEIVVNPPKSLKPPGQPRKRRARQGGDSRQTKRVVHCSRCYQTGHFRTTCATPI